MCTGWGKGGVEVREGGMWLFREKVRQYNFSSLSTCALKYKSYMPLVSYSVVSCGFFS